ncbi:MAG: hypothetical protein VKK62_04270 [Synechococcaceae cyanobacterium]|nr:hypothetical protein [Synechococcaceae cyanobacterium]
MQAAPGNPTAPAGTAAGRPAPPRAPEPDPRRLIGAWALTDNRNNLFNVRLFASGRAVSTIGTAGVPPAGTRRLTDAQQRQLGRWQAWGNGVRVDYSDGWTDWIYVGPSGLSHASWPPGEDRGTRPFNHGPAVQLQGRVAEVVGVYSFPPAQAELKPYTATLLSNGQAFNNLDAMAAGVWTLKGSTVVIDWISGWRTTMSLDPATRLQLRHWAPGTDRRGPASGPVRQGSVIE